MSIFRGILSRRFSLQAALGYTNAGKVRPRILLINPWIYDFAAVNLWARPLGLLKVAECLSAFDVELSLIDCMDGSWGKKYAGGKYRKEIVDKPQCLKAIPRRFGRYGMAVGDFGDALRQQSPFDLVLVTSLMSYWYPGILKAIETVRDIYGHVPVILGGIYATLWHGHASKNTGADFIHKGQIGDDIAAVFNTFGFRMRKKSGKRNAFSEEAGVNRCNVTPYYKLGLYEELPFAPIITGVGCPYRCAYCASYLLHGGFTRRDTSETCREIRELSSMGVRDFAFYDDALLVNSESHIKVILRDIIRHGASAHFHCPNGIHARHIDEELACLMKRSGFVTVRLGLETVNVTRQKETGGKVESDDLVNAVRALKNQGFSKDNIGVYLMYGLPGQGLEEVREGVEFLKSLGVRICLTEYSPVPGTECWDKLIDKGIIGEDIDPLLTNNTVFSFLFAGYDPDELKRLKLDVKEYNAP